MTNDYDDADYSARLPMLGVAIPLVIFGLLFCSLGLFLGWLFFSPPIASEAPNPWDRSAAAELQCRQCADFSKEAMGMAR